jgi:transposase
LSALLIFLSLYWPKPGTKVRYLCVDESRFGLKGIKRRRLVRKGIRPIGKVRWQFKSFWVYGAVEPASGESQFWLFSHVDGECFEAFLGALSRAYPEDLLIVQLDNGGFHRKADLQIPENIFLLFQPPYSPEVNPIERVWLYLKDKLAWKAFESLSQLEEKVSEELAKLEASTLMSLTGYPFLMEAVMRSLL